MDLTALRAFAEGLPFVAVVAAMSAAAALFALAATLSKLAADALAALPTGEGVLSFRVRERIRVSVRIKRRRVFSYFVVWTFVSAVSAAISFVAFRTTRTNGDSLSVGLAAVTFLAATASVWRSWVAWRHADESRETLEREIEEAKWTSRDQSRIAASIAELARMDESPPPPVSLV